MEVLNEIKKLTEYCLNCKTKFCSNKGCPLGNDIPEFIKLVKQGNMKEAYEVLSETTILPGVCGRICPHTKQCQGSCVRGIKSEPVSIGDIEAFVFDKAMENNWTLSEIWKNELNNPFIENKKVAVIGGGPSGLTCAAFLTKKGVEVTIFEQYDYLGGLLVHGIPEFRLDKKIVKETTDRILQLGVKVEYNCKLGIDIKLNELVNEYDAVFLSIGANISAKMGVEGENLNGVYGGNELLESNNHPEYKGKIVSVIGGGNVAMDCSRTIKKLRSKTSKYYI